VHASAIVSSFVSATVAFNFMEENKKKMHLFSNSMEENKKKMHLFSNV
jgi:hypothetical protein